jgi:DNA-binding protein HU-beta
VPTPAAAKAPTRKTPAKKLTPARTPAKKAVAKKVAAKKAPAKKVVARTSTPAEKRGAPVRGATKVTKATKKR